MEKLFLGIEIGATKNQIAVGDSKGTVLHCVREKVIPEDGAEGILKWLLRIVPEMIKKGDELGGKVSGIGVGFGGILESSTGKILISVQVKGWQDFMLKDWLESNFGLPAVIINDTVTGGYAEYLNGSGKGSKQFFYTNIGSGIGGVFILNGEYYDGLGYGAAYFGHTYIPDWTGGKPGIPKKVEDLCSGWSIEKRIRTKGYVPADSLLMKSAGGNPDTLTCAMLGSAAEKGDGFALSEIDRVARSLGVGLANILTLISPDCISIGGGVGKMGNILLDPVRKYTEEYSFISSKGRYKIVECSFSDMAVPVGSILFAVKNFG
jgi:glucokinase